MEGNDVEGCDDVRSGEHRSRGGVTAAALSGTKTELSWLGRLEAAPVRFARGGVVVCSGQALAKSKVAEVRMLLECLETWRVGVWRCVVLCCGVERQKRSFE